MIRDMIMQAEKELARQRFGARFPELFAHWDEPGADSLCARLLELPEDTAAIVDKVLADCSAAREGSAVDPSLSPLPDVTVFEALSAEDKDKCWKEGLECIARGKFACVVLGGGQGTRLGSADPKGMFDVGLPSHKSLLQLQAERLLRLHELAREVCPEAESGACVIPWYIMCSEATDAPTERFLEEHDYFGLDRNNVFFFNQGSLPCISFEGSILMEGRNQVALSPDGNGGIYRALVQSGALSDMRKRGVEAVHVHCIDNILIRPCDPAFMYLCHVVKGADAGAAVVPKARPDEPVGVFAQRDGRIGVVEYSEIPSDMARQTHPGTDQLVYNQANIAVHFCTVDFLERAAEWAQESKRYHVARKAIPFFDEASGRMVQPDAPNGIKMEQFIFDVFEIAERFCAVEFPRSEIFSPLKNAEGSSERDNARTCRQDLSALHRRWLEQAGASVEDPEAAVEVSPLLSYGGEGLTQLAQDKVFSGPVVNLEKK